MSGGLLSSATVRGHGLAPECHACHAGYVPSDRIYDLDIATESAAAIPLFGVPMLI